MHITLESDYAIRMVRELLLAGCRTDARSLSESAGVSLRFALKILGKLVPAGVVRSYKGTLGGYEIARPASEITLCDVIEAVEGSYCISRCLEDGYNCPRNEGDGCKVHQAFCRINQQIRQQLQSQTFEELL